MIATGFQANAFLDNAFQIASDAAGDIDIWLHRPIKKQRRKSLHKALDKALDKALSDKRYRRSSQSPASSPQAPWLAEPVLAAPLLDVPAFDPRVAALGDPLASIRADLASVNEQKRREEEDIELLLLSA